MDCEETEAPVARCHRGTVRVMGVCTPVAAPGTPPSMTGIPVAREAEPGELLFDRNVMAAGDTLFARGAGCDPGADVMLTADGELVGRTVADQDGTFETIVHFASFRPGHRAVEGTCGMKLDSSGIAMVLVSADTSASASSVLLPFFLVLGFMAVRYQMAARGRRRARPQRW